MPTGGSGALASQSPARKPSPGPAANRLQPAANRTLPAPASESGLLPEAGPLGQAGLPVRNIPLSTDVAGDTLTGGDSLARDGLAGNGLGVPMGDRLPVGAVQGLASQGGSALGSLPLGGGSPLGGLGGVGAADGLDGVDGVDALGADEDQNSNSQGTPVVAGDAVHVLPPSESAELPAADDLPVFGSLLTGGTLPTRANVNTLPGAAPIPVHTLLAPGTSATGASTGAAYHNASGAVNGMMSGGGTEALPLGDEGLPVVGGLTGPRGTSGSPLDGFGELPVVGGVANGGGPLGGTLGGKHRKPATGAQYVPRHSA
jgi:hypothetical protein